MRVRVWCDAHAAREGPSCALGRPISRMYWAQYIRVISTALEGWERGFLREGRGVRGCAARPRTVRTSLGSGRRREAAKVSGV